MQVGCPGGKLEILQTADGLAGLRLADRGSNGNLVYFDLNVVSAGKRRLLTILDQMFKATDTGALVLIDDPSKSLHTLVCNAILGPSCSMAMNLSGEQLIAKTHDTSLMNSQHIRRDQLWFSEENCERGTKLFLLTGFRTRKVDSNERGYPWGKIGAVPNNASVNKLIVQR